MPTFCRHNRFIERCPICRKTLPGLAPQGGRSKGANAGRASPPAGRVPSRVHSAHARRLRAGGQPVRVTHEQRPEDDGYRSELLPGVHASGEAARLAEEIAFANGRLLALGAAPPDLYAEVRAQAESDLERATWMCFLIAYLSPLQGEDPFAGVRTALDGAASAGEGASPLSGPLLESQHSVPLLESQHSVPLPESPLSAPLPESRLTGPLPKLDGIALGPHTSHDPARGAETLIAYRQWVQHAGGGSETGAEAGGPQEIAFTGDPAWSPQRRFERLFERLALPGFGRMGRYDLLVTLGRLGLYELCADSLHLAAAARGAAANDLTTLAAKRAFAVGEPLYLERRAQTLAAAISVPIETLDLALANWVAPQRATMGFRTDTCDRHALERAHAALELQPSE
jgi:Alpha-glutamyl/putrescinyl thymine pyrophosphorylase clade 3